MSKKKRVAAAITGLALTTGMLVATTETAQAGGNCSASSWKKDSCNQRIVVDPNSQRSSITVRYSGTDVRYYVGRATTGYFLCGSANGANYIYVHSGYNMMIRYHDGNGIQQTMRYYSTGWHLLPWTYRSPQCDNQQTLSPYREWGQINDAYEYKQ